MSGQKTVLLLGLALVLLTTPAFASEGAAAPLRAGETVVLEREDRGALVLTAADDPLIDLVEMEGADVVVRLTPFDRVGLVLGSGRVLVMGPAEHRRVRLRDELTGDALYGVELRVEVLQGAGRVLVTSSEVNGSGLRPKSDAVAQRRRAVQSPRQKPTSQTLIDKAETSGAINAETALLYRVFALFNDSRLPAQYAGDDSRLKDSLYMAEVRDRFSTLSTATQNLLQPFLAPPAYKGSWASPALSAMTVLDLPSPPPCDFFSDKWSWVDTSNNLVRVWYRDDLGDGPLARRHAEAIDNVIWSKLSGLMTGHLPISDINGSCNGGNGRLDIYVTDVARSLTVPYTGCQKTPSFILLRRSADRSVLVHEIFHAFQFSYALSACLSNEKYDWWSEATAQWSEDFVFKDDQYEQNAAPDMLNDPKQPLDFRNDKHEYAAYLLPFYVTRKSGSADFVRASWDNCATQPALEAIDQALSGGFEQVWPAFVRTNWNRAPVKDYQDWDGLKAAAEYDDPDIQSGEDASADLNIELPRLSATYYDFKFDDDMSSVAFWNGITFNLDTRDVPGGSLYDSKEVSADQKKGIRVQALIKLVGQNDWQTADWTNRPYVTFCLDMLAERIEELVLIVSNSEFKDRSRTVKPAGMAPVLWVSNMGCWQWKGEATYTDPFGSRIFATALWTREEKQEPPFVSYKAEGTETWSVSGQCSGGGTVPIVPDLSFLFTYNFTPRTSSFRRTYNTVAADTRQFSVTCPGPQTVPFSLMPWVNAPPAPLAEGIPGARWVKVSAAGDKMDDTYTPGGDLVWQWHFVAERQ